MQRGQRRHFGIAVMRRDIKRELRNLGGLTEEELTELAASMVEIARRKLAG